MENLLQFALDLSKQKKMTKREIAISSIKDWLPDLENPEIEQLISDALDTMED